eukprot:3020752-Amphidinium_carterae.1
MVMWAWDLRLTPTMFCFVLLFANAGSSLAQTTSLPPFLDLCSLALLAPWAQLASSFPEMTRSSSGTPPTCAQVLMLQEKKLHCSSLLCVSE